MSIVRFCSSIVLIRTLPRRTHRTHRPPFWSAGEAPLALTARMNDVPARCWTEDVVKNNPVTEIADVAVRRRASACGRCRGEATQGAQQADSSQERGERQKLLHDSHFRWRFCRHRA